MAVKLQYDGGEWEPAAEITAGNKRVFTLPIVPRRCIFLRIRLEGQGDAVLYSIMKTVEGSTELPVSSMK